MISGIRKEITHAQHHDQSVNVNGDYKEIFTPLEVGRIKILDNTKCWKGCGSAGTLIFCLWECKKMPLWYYHINLKIYVLCDSTVPFFGIHTRDVLSHIHREMYLIKSVHRYTVYNTNTPRMGEEKNKWQCTCKMEHQTPG